MKKAACRGVWLIRGLTLLAILVLIAVATNRNWKLFSWLESRQYAAGVADFLIAVAGGVAVGFVAGWVVAPAGGLAPSGATGPLGLQDQQIEVLAARWRFVAGEEAGKGLDPGRAAEAAELTKDLEVAIARRDEVSRRSQARASVTALGAVAFLSGFAGTAFPTVGTGGVTPAAATSAFALGAGVAFLGIALRFAIDSLQARCGGDRSA